MGGGRSEELGRVVGGGGGKVPGVVIAGGGGGGGESRARPPRPPVGVGGWGELTLKRAATLADNWIPGPTADLKRLLEGKRRFLDDRRAAGRTASITEWPLTRDVIIADTDRAARELAERHIMVAYRKEYAGGWRHPFIDASIATDLDRLMADRFIIGGAPDPVSLVAPVLEADSATHPI